MADEFGYPEYVVEILNELKELRREVARLQRDVADLAKRLAEPQRQMSDSEAVLASLREAVEKLNAAASAVVENASLIRAAVAEDGQRRDDTCLAVLERLMALQETLNKLYVK
ncbi:MAG: hypothetical protein JHC20_05575 [Pyrobaculum sp.]|nr:hypothetical protein [Pyrobaculum sp.]